VNLNDLETFVLVAELGTFAEAARRLRVPKSTITRRVARLEQDLGRSLLNRTARSFAISDEGRALLDRCGPPLRELAEVDRALGDGQAVPRGRLRVTTSVDIGMTDFVGELIAGYTRTFAGVQVVLELTNRTVDLLAEDFDVAFRSHTAPLQDGDHLVARKLGVMSTGVYASPAYVKERGTLERWEDVGRHRTVCHAIAHRKRWPAQPTITADDYGAVAVLLAGGGGLGALPTWVAAPFVERSALVRLPIEWSVPPASVTLVWLRSRHLAPRVRAFIDLATSRAASAGWPG
jgi:DNA-binding transcriptional LysR family regulator